MTDRRAFLKLSALASGAVGLGLTPSASAAAETTSPKRNSTPRAAAPLDILILGGTGFTGPEQVEYATARGHKITLLNRNRTRPDFFKGRVEQLVGDLNDDVTALEGRKFDVVIDNPTTFPAWVRNAAQHLAGKTRHYIFISTISVYPDIRSSGPGSSSAASRSSPSTHRRLLDRAQKPSPGTPAPPCRASGPKGAREKIGEHELARGEENPTASGVARL